METDQHAEFGSLARENAMLVKVVGGLWAILSVVLAGFFAFWASSLGIQIDHLHTQMDKQWDSQIQRSERISQIENRLAVDEQRQSVNDAETGDLSKEHRAVMRDLALIKSKLRMEQ